MKTEVSSFPFPIPVYNLESEVSNITIKYLE